MQHGTDMEWTRNGLGGFAYGGKGKGRVAVEVGLVGWWVFVLA